MIWGVKQGIGSYAVKRLPLLLPSHDIPSDLIPFPSQSNLLILVWHLGFSILLSLSLSPRSLHLLNAPPEPGLRQILKSDAQGNKDIPMF